jgi:hypothetical protein
VREDKSRRGIIRSMTQLRKAKAQTDAESAKILAVDVYVCIADVRAP